MASVYDLKPGFQSLLRPLLGPLRAIGLKPNHVTWAALVGSVLVGMFVCVSRGPRALLVLALWLLVRMALNALDGMMAREGDQATTYGSVLNEVGDCVADIVLYMPLACVHPAAAGPLVAFVIAAVMTEFCGVLGAALGAERSYLGPMGKSDRALLVGVTAACTAWLWFLIVLWPLVFSAAAVLAGHTSLRRLREALRQLRSDERV